MSGSALRISYTGIECKLVSTEEQNRRHDQPGELLVKCWCSSLVILTTKANRETFQDANAHGDEAYPKGPLG